MLREEWIKEEEEEEEVNILHWNVFFEKSFHGIIKKIICHWKSFILKN